MANVAGKMAAALLQGQQQGQQMFQRAQNVIDLRAERAQRDKQIAMQDLSLVEKFIADPNAWRNSTPEKQGIMLGAYNTARARVGLPLVDSIENPLHNMWLEFQHKIRVHAQESDQSPDDIKRDIKDSARSIFGDGFLNDKNVTLQDAAMVAGAGKDSETVNDWQAEIDNMVDKYANKPNEQTIAKQKADYDRYIPEHQQFLAANGVDYNQKGYFEKLAKLAVPQVTPGASAMVAMPGVVDPNTGVMDMTRNVVDKLADSIKPGFIPKTIDQVKQQDRNSAAIRPFLADMSKARSSGAKSDELVGAYYPAMNALGYDGTPEDLVKFIDSLPTTELNKANSTISKNNASANLTNIKADYVPKEWELKNREQVSKDNYRDAQVAIDKARLAMQEYKAKHPTKGASSNSNTNTTRLMSQRNSLNNTISKLEKDVIAFEYDPSTGERYKTIPNDVKAAQGRSKARLNEEYKLLNIIDQMIKNQPTNGIPPKWNDGGILAPFVPGSNGTKIVPSKNKFKKPIAKDVEEAFLGGMSDADIVRYGKKEHPGVNIKSILSNVKKAHGK